jgi:hypothetical protein
MATQNFMTWKELDAQKRKDLIAWFNRREITNVEKARLAKLVREGRFEAWDCPECGERVYNGAPEDWGHFQGVKQVDYVSYPGNSEKYTVQYRIKMCDHCRMTK